jgi:hypothetical protein
VNTIEGQLRDAYRAAAETVRPQTVLRRVSPLPSPGRRAGRSRHARIRRPRRRLLIPLAAAAGVTAVVTAVALLPRVAPGRPAKTGPAPSGVLTTPHFFVALEWSLPPSMSVFNATTGKQGARITLPFPATQLAGVATGDGRTFVVAAASAQACSTSLYQFSVAGDGRPSALAPFTKIPGVASPWSMAVSANGQIVAFEALACQGGQIQQPTPVHPRAEGYLSVLNTATGQAKRWTFERYFGNLATNAGSVSISADGGLVGFGSRVLDTSAAPGSLDAHSRVVVQPEEFGHSVIPGGLNIAPDGKSAYFYTFQVAGVRPAAWQLGSLDLATGQTQLVRNFPGGNWPTAAAFDPTGRYLLTEFARPATGLAVLDVSTGRLTQLNANWTGNPQIAW